MSTTLTLVAFGLLAAGDLHRRRCGTALARAAHELRAPLCAARLALEGLGDGARVRAIDLELRRAALALEDLVAAPHGRRVGERADVVDLRDLLGETAESWRALADEAGVALRVDPPPEPIAVRADPLRLVQACGNLVANAVEHGGGPVQVRARAAGSVARIEIGDHGPGLPSPVADLVAAARGRRGRRGHGLAIAAAIAERHGGRVTTAPATRGARLVLELPLAKGRSAGRRSSRRRLRAP